MQKIKGFIAALSAAAGALVPAFAQQGDKAVLDSLVASRTITASEASRIARDRTLIIPQRADTLKIQLWGMAQVQYDSIYTDMGDFSETTRGFNLRRIFAGVKTDITDSLKGYFVVDFMRQNTNGSDYILDAYVTKAVDFGDLAGNLHVGIKKVQFGLEENISCMKLSTVDTSIATRYFIYSQRWSRAHKSESRIGFGQRYVGLFWDGKVHKVDGLSYYAAVTNSMNNTIFPDSHLAAKDSNPRADDSVNCWFTVDYVRKFDDFTTRFGFKSGYGPGANIVSDDKYGAIAAINPYFELKYADDLTFWGEFIAADIQYGKNDGEEQALPMGYNIGAEYRFDIGSAGRLGVAARFSQLFTDGRGVSTKDTVTYCRGNVTDTSDQVSFDRAMTAYIGLNWYIKGDDLKLQAGYEWLKFENPIRYSPGAADASMNVVRVQLQAVF